MSPKIPTFSRSPLKENAPVSGPDPAAVAEFLGASTMVGLNTARTQDSPPEAAEPQQRTPPRRRPAADSEEATVYRTVNVKLNKRRYSQLKLLSTVTDTAMQYYLEDLVDELLERYQHLIPNYTPKP